VSVRFLPIAICYPRSISGDPPLTTAPRIFLLSVHAKAVSTSALAAYVDFWAPSLMVGHDQSPMPVAFPGLAWIGNDGQVGSGYSWEGSWAHLEENIAFQSYH